MSLLARVLLLILIPLSTFAPRAVAAVEFVPNQYVIKLKPGKSLRTALRGLVEQKGVNLSAQSFSTDDQFAIVTIKNLKSTQALSLLSSDPAIEIAEPNYIYRTQALQNAQPADELFGQLWGLNNSGQADSAGQLGRAGADISALETWAQGRVGSRDIKVAVIDTGVDYNHPDLKANMWTNPGEIAGNGVDDDNNGFVDDVHGWNFEKNTSDPMDDHYHGTHCAGTIGAVANNGMGVAGVVWNVTMIPVKFLGANGGTLAGAIQSIQYATQLNVDLMSNSWGGGGFSQLLFDAIKAATDKGIVFIAAAGNDGKDNDRSPSYPASYQIPGVISVAATDNRDQIAGFSNFGVRSVHVAAPGVKILSTVPSKDGNYKVLSGTSMATPHVSGMVAMLLSERGRMNPEDVKTALIKSSDPVRALSKKSVSKGRVNLFNLMNNVTPEPVVPPAESDWVDYETNQTIESAHPYADNANLQFAVKVPGAKYIRIVFESIDVESGYDFVGVQQADGTEIEKLSGKASNYTTDYLEGDAAQITLKSDSSQTGYGFKVAKIQVIR